MLSACGGGGTSNDNGSGDTAAPTVPAGLSATPDGSAAISLSWSSSTDSGGSGLQDYVVYRDGSEIATVTSTSHRDSALSSDTLYSYEVSARDRAGNESARSTPATARTGGTAASGLDARPVNTSCVAPERPVSTAGVSVQRVFANLSFQEPVGLFQAPGDSSRWFVLERRGRVRVFPNSSDVTQAQLSTFLDLSSRIPQAAIDEIEAGLLGLAFHPQFASNGRFFVFYSGQADSGYRIKSRISEFTSSADRSTAALSSERILIQANKLESNHNGGQLAFGPDNLLYAGLGDGGGANDPEGNGQDRNNLFAKILRIDVDSGTPYGIPPSNPFAGNARCEISYSPASANAPRNTPCPEIFAYGLRNPWRFSFDRGGTQDLWVADVGQGGFEEIDRVTLGGNYGWSIREGSGCLSGTSCPSSSNGVPLIAPVHEIPHDEISAIIGGFVYRGSAMSGLVGTYLFANFAPGVIYALVSDGSGGYTRRQLTTTALQISTFGEDTNGEIHAVDFAGGGLYRLAQAGQSSNSIPSNLSDTGCVSSEDPTLPAAGLIPYKPNAPFWSDGADKERWLALPEGENITVGADGDWSFPNGTVLVKNFRLGGQLVETRLFMRHPDGEWAGYTYQWNSAQTSATRVVGGSITTIGSQTWIYPSEAQCLQCHTSAAGNSLGLESAQENGNHLYPQTGRTANQITTLKHIGVLPQETPDPDALAAYPDPYDPDSGSILERARAYLHTNCANCHRPGGGTNVNMDLRNATAVDDTATCEVEPTGGDLGVAGARRVVPGDPSRSLVYLRMSRRDSSQMPPIASAEVDTAGAALLEAWIQNMDAGCD